MTHSPFIWDGKHSIAVTIHTSGWNAYLDGRGLAACPYKSGSEAAAHWLAGWSDAEDVK